MPHDKLRAAARERMARTGEPYAAARRAVLAQYQATRGEEPPPRAGRQLLMSGEIHDWLARLRDGDPEAAKLVGQTLAVLLNGGELVGEPLVASTADSWPAALADGLDRSYQERLDRLALVRRGVSDCADLFKDIGEHSQELESALSALRVRQGRLTEAGKTAEAERTATALAAAQPLTAELRDLRAKVARTGLRLGEEMQRLQTRSTAFRGRKEVLKASYASANLDLALDGGTAEARLLRDVITEMERELGQGPWPHGLTELRPAGPDGNRFRILFAFEPSGAVLLLAVLDGAAAIGNRFLEAVLLSADRLRQVRAGEAPDAAEHGYDSTRDFLEEFYPSSSSSSPSPA
jgi:hypothetical protein